MHWVKGEQIMYKLNVVKGSEILEIAKISKNVPTLALIYVFILVWSSPNTHTEPYYW